MVRVLPHADMGKVLSLSKRRGFVFQSSDIYGGLGSTWDYGPLGVELKRHVKEAWWRSVILDRDDMVGLDAAILMHPKTWVASGHVENFTDPLVECRNCNQRFRADQLKFASKVRIDAQNARLELPSAQGSGHIVFHEFRIYAPDGSMKLEWAILESGEFKYDPLAAVRIPGLSPNERALQTGTHLNPGDRSYAIGFATPLDKPANVSARLTMIFNDGSGRLEPVALNARLADRQVSLGDPPPTCPECGGVGSLTDPRMFNLMFKTFMGPAEDTAHEVYLRPETAQGIFVNFKNVLDSTRRKLPFGIGQIGKAFRNEITPGNFTFRTREFEQMEVEYFVKPGTDEEWLQSWVQSRFEWYVAHGIRPENLRRRPHAPDELAHYARDCYDIEYRFPWGWAELEGVANRTDFDLRQHAEASGQDLTYFDDETKLRYFPYVIEPSGGVDRATLAFWLDAYDEEPDGEDTRVVLRLHRKLAPVTVATLPLSRNARLVPTAREVFARLRKHFNAQYDDAQSIGRRYRRQDEIGTPYCVTVDFETLDDRRVTIRDRDTMHQSRIPIADLVGVLQDKLEHGW